MKEFLKLIGFVVLFTGGVIAFFYLMAYGIASEIAKKVNNSKAIEYCKSHKCE